MYPWPSFLPDLTYWHAWHSSRDTLPERWKRMDLPSICRELGVPEWRTVRPWRLELRGIPVERRQDAEQKTVAWRTGSATLTARWVLGPDGDWWQAEYPVKSAADFGAAAEILAARSYIPEPSGIANAEGPGVIAALEMPRSPLAELFHTFLGWSEGMMLFLEEPDVVKGLLEILDGKVRHLQAEIARMPGNRAISPDNLDGRFVAPAMFADSLAPLYAYAAETLHAEGKDFVVHVGGPIGSLLPGLVGCGVDCAEGICGAPQGDTTLADARAACGPGMALWGGIPQDVLLATHTQAEFETGVQAAFADATGDAQAVVGVADRVPVDALPERLVELARLSREHGRREA
jgi:hypothetical protein